MPRVREPMGATMLNIDGLADQIEDYHANARLSLPDLVLVPRSAYVMGDTISRRWGVSAGRILHACVEKVDSAALEEDASQFAVGQFPGSDEVAGRNLLVLDAICKTGDTLDFVVSKLRELGAQSVMSAVLYKKTERGVESLHEPDFFVAARKEFIIFDWEVHEHLPTGQSVTNWGWNLQA